MKLSHLAALACVTIQLVASSAGARVQVVINNLDGPGEGFNDPTPIVPAGGNAASTRGAARLAAFQVAASLWGARLSPRPGVPAPRIDVDARFDSLTCSATSGVLGGAGAGSMHKDFPGAPLPGTYYSQALANVLAGDDLAPGVAAIFATFNSDVDDPACLGSTSWYYGFDEHPPSGSVDLVTTVMHELAHGLGFQSMVDLTTGETTLPGGDAFSAHLAQLGAVPSAYSGIPSKSGVGSIGYA